MAEKRMSKLEIWSKSATIITSVCLVFITYGIYRVNRNTSVYNFRPYVGIRSILVIHSEDKLEAVVTIENTGIVPANNLRIELFNELPDSALKKISEQDSRVGVLFPNADIIINPYVAGEPAGIKSLVSGKAEWFLKIIITYSGVNTKGHKTEYLCRYNYETKLFTPLDGFAN